MKKLVFVSAAVLAVAFSACGNKAAQSENASKAETTVVAEDNACKEACDSTKHDCQGNCEAAEKKHDCKGNCENAEKKHDCKGNCENAEKKHDCKGNCENAEKKHDCKGNCKK